MLNIALPANSSADAFYLTAFTAKGDTICNWSWAIQSPAVMVKKVIAVSKVAAVTIKEDEQTLAVNCDSIVYHFDKKTGMLQKVFNGKNEISFGDGPALGSGMQTLAVFKQSRQGDALVVEPSYNGDSLRVKWTFQPGKLPKLEYSYLTKDTADFMGITFNYPEEKIKGMKWLGRGPYRVWKNRLKGQQLGVWEKAYNNTVTGENWNYPEFKGWHSELYWVKLQNKESDFTIYTDQQNIFLQMLQPQKPKAAGNNHTSPTFAESNIGFMHAISAIGTKFQNAEVMGPQSRKNVRQGNIPLTGTLYFEFTPGSAD